MLVHRFTISIKDEDTCLLNYLSKRAHGYVTKTSTVTAESMM